MSCGLGSSQEEAFKLLALRDEAPWSLVNAESAAVSRADRLLRSRSRGILGGVHWALPPSQPPFYKVANALRRLLSRNYSPDLTFHQLAWVPYPHSIARLDIVHRIASPYFFTVK